MGNVREFIIISSSCIGKSICIIVIYLTADIYHFGFEPLSYLSPFIVFIVVAFSGGAVDEGLVGELERQEGAAGAVQCGH